MMLPHARRSLVPWNMVEHIPWLHPQHLTPGFEHAQGQQRVFLVGQLADGVAMQPGPSRKLPSAPSALV